jgi:glucose-6-phosphate-specific signal transduction histidine kinase
MPELDGSRAGERSNEVRARLVGLVMAVLLAPIYFLVGHFTDENRGFVVFCVVAVFACVIYVLRKRALRPRLLLPIVILFAVEISIALVVPLPSKIPGFIMISISTGDGAILIWILSFFDRTLRDEDDEGPRYSA